MSEATTIRLTALDAEVAEKLRLALGLLSLSEAVRVALRISTASPGKTLLENMRD